MSQQFKSLATVLCSEVGFGKTRTMMHNVLMATNRSRDVIAVVVSEETGPSMLTRVMLDTRTSALEIHNDRIVFASEENLMLVLRDILPQGRVHLFIDAPSQTFFVTPSGTESKILRFTNPRFNEAAELVNALTVTTHLSALL